MESKNGIGISVGNLLPRLAIQPQEFSQDLELSAFSDYTTEKGLQFTNKSSVGLILCIFYIPTENLQKKKSILIMVCHSNLASLKINGDKR